MGVTFLWEIQGAALSPEPDLTTVSQHSGKPGVSRAIVSALPVESQGTSGLPV